MLVFADRIARVPESASLFVFHALYLPNIQAIKFADEHGELSRRVSTTMTAVRLLVGQEHERDAYHRTTQPIWLAAEGAQDRPRVDPPIVFSVGVVDLIELLGELPADDFVLPAAFRDPQSNRWNDADDDAAPFDTVAPFFTRRFEPFGAALRRLRAYGFERIALLSLVPPTADDAACRLIVRMTGRHFSSGRYRAALRYKIAYVLNGMLRDIACTEGLTFIDRWAAQTADGLQLPGLLHDNVHLDSRMADATIEAIVRTFAPA